MAIYNTEITASSLPSTFETSGWQKLEKTDMCHLHLHTEHSFLDGIPNIWDPSTETSPLLERVIELGQDSVAVTDHGEVSGHLRLQRAARKYDVKPIFGIEGYFTEDRFVKEGRKGENYEHMTLLAIDDKGLSNLWALSSLAFIEGSYYGDPRFDWDLLEKYSEGIIATGGCMGGCVARFFHQQGKYYDVERGYDRISKFLDIFGDRFYLELHTMRSEDHSVLNRELAQLGQEFSVPLLAVGDCHYLRPEDWKHHEHMTAIQMGMTVNSPNRFTYGENQLAMLGTDDVQRRIGQDLLDENLVAESIKNTRLVADLCSARIHDDELHMPVFFENVDLDQRQLKRLVEEGFERKCTRVASKEYPLSVYRERLEYELEEINSKNYTGYFLYVHELVVWAKENGQLIGPGRGSAGGCLVAWLLDITEIDPVPPGLLFERFLDPGRVSLPDIDIDFPKWERHLAREMLEEKYGKYNIATVGTLNTLKPKQALRDLCRGLDVPRGDANRMSSLIEETGLSGAPSWDWDEVQDLYGAQFEPWRQKYPELFELLEKSSGQIRHSGAHAAGVVVSKESLIGSLPLRLKSGDIRTQMDMSDVEALGFVKIDMLGIRNLSTLMQAFKLIRERHGVEINPYDWQYEWDKYYGDEKVWESIGTGKNIGSFQIETSGLRNLVKRYLPKNMEDLCAMISVFRPGITRAQTLVCPQCTAQAQSGGIGAECPACGWKGREEDTTQLNLLEYYMRKREKRLDVVYKHPLLEPILGRTYGNFVYQEQIMQACVSLAGYTLAETDRVRKILGKMLYSKMQEERAIFVQGCINNDIEESTAHSIFDDMASFGTYGYNKCARGNNTRIKLPDGSTKWLSWLYKNQDKHTEIMSMWPDGEIRPHKYKRIVKTGKKQVFTVRAKGKYRLDVTEDHRLLTTRGYVRVRDLVVGEDELIVDESRLSDKARKARSQNMTKLNQTEAQRERASDRMKLYHEENPDARVESLRRINERHREILDCPEEGLERRQYMSQVMKAKHEDLEWRMDWLRSQEDKIRRAKASGPGWGIQTSLSDERICDSISEARVGQYLLDRGIEFELHKPVSNGRKICDFYFDGMYWEYDGWGRGDKFFEEKYGDLPHVVLHPWDWQAKIDEYLQTQHVSNGALITAIEDGGEHMTYDIEMEDDGPSNFMANDVVSHNSHGWAYATVAYWCSWTKLYYPHEFMAALFQTNERASALYTREARRMGIRVLGPDINESGKSFTLTESGTIRYGLGKIKYVAGGAAAIEEERELNGSFTSIADFVSRVPKRKVNKRAQISLVRVGALNSLVKSEPSETEEDVLHRAMEELWEARGDWASRNEACVKIEKREDGTKYEVACPTCKAVLSKLEHSMRYDWTLHDLAANEQELLDTLVSVDPLAPYTRLIQSEDTFIGEKEMYLEEKARLGGVVTYVRQLVTKRGRNPGQPMCQLWVEPMIRVDDEGLEVDLEEEGPVEDEAIQIVCFPEVYRKFQEKIEVGAPVLVDVKKLQNGLSLENLFRLDEIVK